MAALHKASPASWQEDAGKCPLVSLFSLLGPLQPLWEGRPFPATPGRKTDKLFCCFNFFLFILSSHFRKTFDYVELEGTL